MCLEESLRVLKKGGYFVVAYIPILYLNQMIAMLDFKYVNEQFDTWLAYHLSACAEKTIFDMSNHVVIIGKKIELPVK